MRCLRRTLWATLLLCLPWSAAAAEGVGLFSADAGTTPLHPPARRLFTEDAGSDGGPHGNGFPELSAPRELRSRSARIDVGRLSAARSEVAQGRPHHLRLNLFADAGFDALIERTAPTASGYTLTGRLADEPLSMVVVAVNGGHVAGTVWSSRGVHSIRARGGGAVVRQLDPAAGGRCGVGEAPLGMGPPSPPPGPSYAARKPLSAVPSQAINPPSPPRTAAARNVMPRTDDAHPPDDGSVIDVLFVYPALVRRFEGGHRAMRALIDRDVAMVNEAYRASGAEQRIALVAAVETDLPLSVVTDNPGVLFKLKSESDGHMDEVHALRDSYAADLVNLHLGSTIGVMPADEEASILNRYSLPDADAVAAFTVSRSINLAHELGHNMGLHHDRAEVYPPDAPAVLQGLLHPYSYGYLAPKPNDAYPWATIMAYYGHRLPRFSNPRQKYPDESGVPLGVPGEEWTTRVDGPADAVRSLNNTRRLVANHRASAARCAYALSPPPPDVPAAGGVYRVRVEAPPGCAWGARADGDGFAAVTSGAGGNGPGEVAFRVLANEGLEREPAILVAGEVYPVRQAAGRTVKSVCERAPSIRRAILHKVGKSCEDVAAADLASITTLGWEDVKGDLTVLPPGTFDGLRNLQWLVLSGKSLRTVAPGAFDGLAKLSWLWLMDNNLSKVAPGAFRGMPSLQLLVLLGNRLTLQPGVFSGLSGLETLDLRGNGIAKLAPNSFEGLSNLHSLLLEDNELETLEPGAFGGLPRLRNLRLDDNELETLEPGAFGGLPRLGFLGLEDNELEALEPGVFQGLEKLGTLNLRNNRLATLKPGMFVGLPGLRHLALDRNGIAALEPGVFDGLDGLFGLYLDDNRLTELKPGAFAHLPDLRNLFLEGNALRELDRSVFGNDPPRFITRLHLGGNNLRSLQPGLTALLRETGRSGEAWLTSLRLDANQLESLPAGLFEGLTLLLKLDLRRNPGAPFALRANLVALPAADAGSSRPNAVAAEVAEGAPFDMTVRLSAAGAALSASEVLIPKGGVRSEPVSIAASGAGPVAVRLSLAHEAEIDQCDEEQWPRTRVFCYGGIQPVAGPPLVLYGLPDQALPPDGAVNLHLPSAFPDLPDGTAYAAESNNPAVAEVAISGGTMTVIAIDSGVTTLTVTATGDDGKHEARRFTITVEQPVNSYWGGWRSVLLRPPPAADGNES